jgi:hypothetical protein
MGGRLRLNEWRVADGPDGKMMLETDHLRLDGPDRARDGRYLCLALAHNEITLIEHFLDHYRGCGDISFVVIDDRSDDGTSDILRRADDVTVMVPKDGSTYREHKRQWRSDTLDLVADGRWVLLPDVDEFLVWHGQPERGFRDLIGRLDDERAGALFAVMVDMYADRAIEDHVLTPGEDPRTVFPYFDAPHADPVSTWMEPAPSRFLKRWPTPEMVVLGGMRQRMFAPPEHRPGPVTRMARARFGCIGDHARRAGTVSRLLTRSPKSAHPPYNISKLPLIKWQAGMEVYGGAHAVRPGLRLGRERAALLHFPLTRGRSGLEYIIGRGQHMAGAQYYRWILDRAEASPMFEGSRRYDGPASLRAYIRAP